MGHFKPKVIAFYGTAILSVLALFTVVTAYGEANLKAPPSIAGRYRIPADALPGCRPSLSYLLLLQQSGIYLTAALVPEATSVAKQDMAKDRQSLQGRWQNGQLILQGTIANPACDKQQLQLAGTITGQTLEGILKVGNQQKEITTQREETEQPTQSTH